MGNQQARVAILHYAAPPTIGGVEATIGTHAQLLVAHSYPVKLIAGQGAAFDPRIPVEIIAEADSQAPRVLEVNRELADGRVTEKFHALARELTQALTAAVQEVDVLIAHNVLSLHKNLALTAALSQVCDGQRVKIVAWCHDFAWNDPQYAGQVHPGPPWDLLRAPWNGVSYVVVSETRRSELRELWKNSQADISVVPPGIDPLEFFGLAQTTAKWVDQFSLLKASPLLILPARLTRRKKIEQAIEIVAALVQAGWAPKLLVTGPPGAHNPTNLAYLEKLRQLRKELDVETAVVFWYDYGAVSREMMRDLYLLADALLFPSEREGFGIPLLEAGLARLPIFCSDLPVFHESARDHAHYFGPDANPGAIAGLIGQVLEKDAAFQLKKRIIQRYSWENIFTERIEPLLR